MKGMQLKGARSSVYVEILCHVESQRKIAQNFDVKGADFSYLALR